jgi:hypothetical protein
MRLSLKLFDVNPEELPTHLRSEVQRLVTQDPVGFVRAIVMQAAAEALPPCSRQQSS